MSCITKSLCCRPETNTILQINATSIKTYFKVRFLDKRL